MSRKWLKPNWEPGLTIPYLPIDHLIEQGISALFLDVDKTILYGKDIEVLEIVSTWIKTSKQHFIIHLLSNNPSKKRKAASFLPTPFGPLKRYALAKRP